MSSRRASSPALTGSERPAWGVEPCAGSTSGGEEGLRTPERSAGPPGSTSVTMTAWPGPPSLMPSPTPQASTPAGPPWWRPPDVEPQLSPKLHHDTLPNPPPSPAAAPPWPRCLAASCRGGEEECHARGPGAACRSWTTTLALLSRCALHVASLSPPAARLTARAPRGPGPDAPPLRCRLRRDAEWVSPGLLPASETALRPAQGAGAG